MWRETNDKFIFTTCQLKPTVTTIEQVIGSLNYGRDEVCWQLNWPSWRIVGMRILLLGLCMAASLSYGQDIDRTQRTLITKTTATWCPPCGGWGWDLFEHLVDDNEDAAILMATHYSGDLYSQAADDFSEVFDATGQPQFFLDGTRVSASSATATQARVAVASATQQAAGQLADVGLEIVNMSEAGGREYRFDVHTEFFSSMPGSYNVALYAVEDSVINSQANRGSMAVHMRVLRESLLGGSFGVPLSTQNPSAGYTETAQVLVTPRPLVWKILDTRLVAIVWADEGNGQYRYVNGFELEEWQLAINTKELSNAQARLTGFGESGTLQSRLTTRVALPDARLTLLDLQGREVAQRELGTLNVGTYQTDWTEVALPSGIYLVRLSSQLGERTVRVAMP